MKKWIIGGSFAAMVAVLVCCYFIVGFSLSGSGSGKSDSPVKYLTIHLDKVVKPDFKDIFSSIEIVPLELNDSSIVGNIYRKKLYIPGKYYVIADASHAIKVFDMNGKFVSSSEKCLGKGPTEYYILQDVSYNSEDDTFVILDPFGNMTTYTSSFEFISKKKIMIQTKDRPRELFILNKHLCILADSSERGWYYVYNYSTDQLIKKVEYPEVIYPMSSVTSPFNYMDGHLYFIPPVISDYIFEIDQKSYTPIPFYYFDGGKSSITSDDVKGLVWGSEEGSRFVVEESTKFSPAARLFNKGYVVSTYLKGKEIYFNFCHLVSGNNTTVSCKYGDFPTFPHFFALDKDNTLITIMYPFELKNYMDSSLVCNKELIRSMNEEDNPCIVKYKLK